MELNEMQSFFVKSMNKIDFSDEIQNLSNGILNIEYKINHLGMMNLAELVVRTKEYTASDLQQVLMGG